MLMNVKKLLTLVLETQLHALIRKEVTPAHAKEVILATEEHVTVSSFLAALGKSTFWPPTVYMAEKRQRLTTT